MNEFIYDLRSDPINNEFIENLTQESVIDLRTHIRNLVLLEGLEPSQNLTTQINNSTDSLKNDS
jgi:hypothetical protein